MEVYINFLIVTLFNSQIT